MQNVENHWTTSPSNQQHVPEVALSTFRKAERYVDGLSLEGVLEVLGYSNELIAETKDELTNEGDFFPASEWAAHVAERTDGFKSQAVEELCK